MNTIIDVINVITAVIALASVIVKMTPNLDDDKAFAKIMIKIQPILDALSLRPTNK